MIKDSYAIHNIAHIYDIPININKEETYCQGLIEAVKRLNWLINDKKCKVYLHDTAGATRAPSVAIIYTCLYMKHF